MMSIQVSQERLVHFQVSLFIIELNFFVLSILLGSDWHVRVCIGQSSEFGSCS